MTYKTRNQYTIQRTFYLTPAQARKLDEVRREKKYPTESSFMRAIIGEGLKSVKDFDPEDFNN